MKSSVHISWYYSVAAISSATRSLCDQWTQCDFSSSAGEGPIQATSFYPYGLPMAERSKADINRRKYSGKELYTHSGYDTYNFETRQYHPAVPRFTSPDPLAEKFYEMGIYTFCAANPIRNVDPSGMDHYQMDEKANFTFIKQTDDNFDVIIGPSGASIETSKEFMGNMKYEQHKANINSIGEEVIENVAITSSKQDLKNIYEFIATESKVEISFVRAETQNTIIDYIGTSHKKMSDVSISVIIDRNEPGSILNATHSHPGGDRRASKSDTIFAKKIQLIHPRAEFYIFHPESGTYREYDGYTDPNRFEEIIVTSDNRVYYNY